MPTPWDEDALSASHTVVAVLRLVVRSSGQLAHGELVTPTGRVTARFRTWDELAAALHDWLARADGEA